MTGVAGAMARVSCRRGHEREVVPRGLEMAAGGAGTAGLEGGWSSGGQAVGSRLRKQAHESRRTRAAARRLLDEAGIRRRSSRVLRPVESNKEATLVQWRGSLARPWWNAPAKASMVFLLIQKKKEGEF